MKMIQLYFDFVTLIQLKSKMHVFMVKGISYIFKCRLKMFLMLGGGACRLMHQCTLQICTRNIKKPLSLTFVISSYKSPKKIGAFYPPTKLPFPFIVDFYFSKFMMYLSFLIIFSFYCNISTLFCALGQVIRSQEAFNVILTWKSRPRFNIRTNNVYHHVNCVANVANNHLVLQSLDAMLVSKTSFPC
jgi:hypothetical protein